LFNSSQSGEAGQARLYFVARVLFDLGFAVRAESGFVAGVADRERGAPTPGELEERVPVVIEALRSGLDFDAALPSIFDGAATPAWRATGALRPRGAKRWTRSWRRSARGPRRPRGWRPGSAPSCRRSARRRSVSRAPSSPSAVP